MQPDFCAFHYKFTGKERDPESGVDYFGARYYESSMGRFISPDRTPLGIAPADPQSWNLYSYTRNRPTQSIDAGGAWATSVHRHMVSVALEGIVSAGELKQLQHRQDVMDSDANDMKDQRKHYMAVPGQDPAVAKHNADQFIMDNIDQAKAGTDASGNMSSDAIDHLGDAMHTLEDMTSPMHTTDDGTPKTWRGYGFLGVRGLYHWVNESDESVDWARFGEAIRLTLGAYVQANPVDAAKHGLNADNFLDEANRRIMTEINKAIPDDCCNETMNGAKRACALGNPAACDVLSHIGP